MCDESSIKLHLPPVRRLITNMNEIFKSFIHNNSNPLLEIKHVFLTLLPTILKVFLISYMLAMVGYRSDQISESNCW